MPLSSFQNHCTITNKGASAPQFYDAVSVPPAIKKAFSTVRLSLLEKGDLEDFAPALFLVIPANHQGTLEFQNDFLDKNPTIGILVGTQAQVTLIEHHKSESSRAKKEENPPLVCRNEFQSQRQIRGARGVALRGEVEGSKPCETIQIITGAGSTVDYLLATERMPSFNGTYKALVGQDSVFTWHLMGTVENEHKLHFSIHHPHFSSTGYINGALRSSGKSKTTLNLLNHHIGTHTGGEIHFRGIGEQEARAGVSGLVMIDKDAAFTNSHFFANVLSLSPKSHVEAEPNLEILNNEVKCTHAAAIGSIDDEAVHYLASRGISPEEAQKLITKGFLRALLPYVKNKIITEKFEKWMS